MKINEETISLYAEQMATEEEMKKFPAVEIYYDGTKYWLADGHHRRAAAEKAGHNKVWAVVKSGTRNDALWGAILGNGKQGFGLTKKDRNRAILLSVERFPDKSNRVIAEALGCSEQSVRRHRPEKSTAPNGAVENPRRTGKDGKSRPAKRTTAKTNTSASSTTKAASKKATAQEHTKDSTPSTPIKTGAVETEPAAERPTVIAPGWKGVKEQQTYSCGVRFEPDPEDDFFDWITREEREQLREDQKSSPALRLVPLIRNYTIQSIPEHDPQYLISCLFSLFQPLYHEKLLYALARKMIAKGATETVQKFLATLTDECQQ